MVMSRHISKMIRNHALGGLTIAVVLSVFCLPGCKAFDVRELRGDSFREDETFSWSGRLRPPDKDVDCVGFSNKARQIEQDFGAR